MTTVTGSDAYLYLKQTQPRRSTMIVHPREILRDITTTSEPITVCEFTEDDLASVADRIRAMHNERERERRACKRLIGYLVVTLIGALSMLALSTAGHFARFIWK